MSNIQKQLLREVLVYNQPKQKHFIFQTATTKWSEIAELIENCDDLEVSDLSKMRAVLQSNKCTLELPNAEIPNDVKQSIFLFEAKVKSGGTVDYTKMSFIELRRTAKAKNLGAELGSNPSKDGLVALLEEYAGIKKEKVSKTSKKGKVTTKVVKVDSPKTNEIKLKDREILDNQPTLAERVAALEGGFCGFLEALHKLTSDYVKPAETEKVEVKETKIGKVDLSKLAKEAEALKIS